MSLRCALLELNWYHDEVLATFVRLLNELGVAPDVYIPVRAAEKGVFPFAADLRYRLLLTDGATPNAQRYRSRRGSPSRFRRYDLVILNSAEPESIIEAFGARSTPTLAVMHNADLLETDERYRSYFASGRRRPLFLARHIAETMASSDSAGSWITPYYFGEVPVQPREAERKPALMCVQGYEPYRRNVASLLDALSDLAGDRPELLVEFLGRGDPDTLATFEEEIERRGLGAYVAATGAETPWSEYLVAVARADFALPLVDREGSAYAPYYTHKLTNSVSFPIGLGVIPIVETELAGLYGIARASVPYETGGLADALRRALSLGPEERGALRSGLSEVRAAGLVQSRTNLRAAITAVIGGRRRL